MHKWQYLCQFWEVISLLPLGPAVLCTLVGLLSPPLTFPGSAGITDACSCILLFYMGFKDWTWVVRYMCKSIFSCWVILLDLNLNSNQGIYWRSYGLALSHILFHLTLTTMKIPDNREMTTLLMNEIHPRVQISPCLRNAPLFPRAYLISGVYLNSDLSISRFWGKVTCMWSRTLA